MKHTLLINPHITVLDLKKLVKSNGESGEIENYKMFFYDGQGPSHLDDDDVIRDYITVHHSQIRLKKVYNSNLN